MKRKGKKIDDNIETEDEEINIELDDEKNNVENTYNIKNINQNIYQGRYYNKNYKK